MSLDAAFLVRSGLANDDLPKAIHEVDDIIKKHTELETIQL